MLWLLALPVVAAVLLYAGSPHGSALLPKLGRFAHDGKPKMVSIDGKPRQITYDPVAARYRLGDT